MTKYNPSNERAKRVYFEWQKEANQKSQNSIDNIRQAISRYEAYTKFQDFKSFNKQKAIAFKKHLAETKAVLSHEPLSKSTLFSTMRHLKDFFKWLAYQKGFRHIDIREIEYLNLSEKDARIAQSPKREAVPTPEQIRQVIFTMPAKTEIERRNRAIVAFTFLTCIRDSAIVSLKLKHIKLEDELVEQIGGEVNTKFGKTIYTYFFPVGEDIKKIVIDWANYLIKEKLYGINDPLFPRTKIGLDKNHYFTSVGIEPVCWQSANQMRGIFKEAFENAGLEYSAPHLFRKTLVRLGESLCKNPEEFKAWSQNLGHEHVSTTFSSYGYVEEYRQGEIIKNLLNNSKQNDQTEQIAQRVTELIKAKINIDQ